MQHESGQIAYAVFVRDDDGSGREVEIDLIEILVGEEAEGLGGAIGREALSGGSGEHKNSGDENEAEGAHGD